MSLSPPSPPPTPPTPAHTARPSPRTAPASTTCRRRAPRATRDSRPPDLAKSLARPFRPTDRRTRRSRWVLRSSTRQAQQAPRPAREQLIRPGATRHQGSNGDLHPRTRRPGLDAAGAARGQPLPGASRCQGRRADARERLAGSEKPIRAQRTPASRSPASSPAARHRTPPSPPAETAPAERSARRRRPPPRPTRPRTPRAAG